MKNAQADRAPFPRSARSTDNPTYFTSVIAETQVRRRTSGFLVTNLTYSPADSEGCDRASHKLGFKHEREYEILTFSDSCNSSTDWDHYLLLAQTKLVVD